MEVEYRFGDSSEASEVVPQEESMSESAAFEAALAKFSTNLIAGDITSELHGFSSGWIAAHDTIRDLTLSVGMLREALEKQDEFNRLYGYHIQDRNAAVLSRVASPGLWEEVKKYMRHTNDCLKELLGGDNECTCGLDALLKGGGKA